MIECDSQWEGMSFGEYQYLTKAKTWEATASAVFVTDNTIYYSYQRLDRVSKHLGISKNYKKMVSNEVYDVVMMSL